jgi:hypothetical protein
MELFISFVLGAIILGVGQWVVRLISDWVQRRRRRLGRRLKIVVLVDNKRRSRRRQCFWPSVLGAASYDLRHRVKYRLISVADELRRGNNPATVLFSPDQTDIVIVNWDAVNGDPVYGSDRAHQFLDHYKPDMLDWLSQGGVMVVESQGASWSPSQAAYACFTSMFKDSFARLFSEMWTLGDSASVHPTQPNNPLVASLRPEDLRLKSGGLWARKPWFPHRLLRSDVQSLRFARRHQQLLYRGWFDSWSSDWNPVLAPVVRDPDTQDVSGKPTATDVDSLPAIAIYRAVRRPTEPGRPIPDTGYIVLTTMFLASSELYALISNFLTFTADARTDS